MTVILKTNDTYVDSTRLQIAFHLISKSPQNMASLCEKMQEPRQKIHYHLTKLIAEGIIYKEGHDYHIQPVLENIELLMNELEPLVQFLVPLLYYDQAKSPVETLTNVLAIFFSRITLEIEEEEE